MSWMTFRERRDIIREQYLNECEYDMSPLDRALLNKQDAFRRGDMMEVERQNKIIKFLKM